MPISDSSSHSPGVETLGYRLKSVKTGSGVDQRPVCYFSNSRFNPITRFNGFERLAWGFNPRCGDVEVLEYGIDARVLLNAV
jgi:hypothetical protein